MKLHRFTWRRAPQTSSCNLLSLLSPVCLLLLIFARSLVSTLASSTDATLQNQNQNQNQTLNYFRNVTAPTISYNSTNSNNNNNNNYNNPSAWLRLRFAQTNSSSSNGSANKSAKLDANDAARLLHRQRQALGVGVGGGYAIEVSPPPANALFQYLPARSKRGDSESRLAAPPLQSAATASSSPSSFAPVAVASGSVYLPAPAAAVAVASGAAAARMASAALINYDDNNEDFEHNLLVTNTCERDFMLVEVKTSRPFYGLIHTLGYRHKLICTIEGDGGTQYKLSISHALNQNDPHHCGVTKLSRGTSSSSSSGGGGETIKSVGGDTDAELGRGELLSAILAIRLHRNIELSDDKYFALNCTKRCRRLDCSSGGQLAIGRLVNNSGLGSKQIATLDNWRHLEVESGGGADEHSDLLQSGQHGRSQLIRTASGGSGGTGEICSIWRSAWLVALLACLALALLGVLISNCLICASLKGNESEQQARPGTGTKKVDKIELDKSAASGRDRDRNRERQRDRDRDLDRTRDRDKERESRRTTSMGKSKQQCIDYDNNNLNYYNYDNNNHFKQQQQQQQEQLKRSHQSSNAPLPVSKQNNNSSKNTSTRQYNR